MNGQVVPAQGIPSRDELPSVALDDAMRHEVATAVALVHHNLPAPELRKTFAANGQDISRPYRRKHAVTGGPESNLSEFTRNLRQQLAMSRRAEVCWL